MKRLLLILFTLIISHYVSEWLSTPQIPSKDEPAKLFSSDAGDSLKRLYLEAINQANREIYLVAYSLRDPQIIRALRQKASQGVKIQATCDHKASKGVGRKLGPGIQTDLIQDRGIMHQKILLIDEELILIGSTNLTSESLTVYSNDVLVLRNEEMAQWIKEHHLKRGESAQFLISDQMLELWFTHKNPQSIERMENLLKGAKKTAQVAMFTWTRADFAEILAKNRKVKKEFYMDRNATSRKIAALLKQKRLPPKIYRKRGLLHHKLAVLDSETLILGSANWTKAAFEQNRDCFVVLHHLNHEQKASCRQIFRSLSYDCK